MQAMDTEIPAHPSAPSQPILLAHAIAFDPGNRLPSLAGLPESCGVFALFADDPKAEPYLAKASHLRRRLHRFLSPAPSQSRRLQLAARIRRIEYTTTASDFASDLVFYNAASTLQTANSPSTRDPQTRLRLRPAAFLKVGFENRFPRATVTTRLTRSALTVLASSPSEPIGPFPSKAAADRYLEQVLDLFLLRRCFENLTPDPAHPGCAYSEMKKCLAPCYGGCTDDRYAQEAAAVHAFLLTRGQSLLAEVAQERTAAAEALEFERAAALHQRFEKIEAVAAQMPEAARPLSHLNGIILQPGSSPQQTADHIDDQAPNRIDGHVDLFLLSRGTLTGPVPYSTLGMRLHNELSGSSSLFTQPMALAPVPLANEPSTNSSARETSAPPAAKDMLEARLETALQALASAAPRQNTTQRLSDHLSLFARWYYRPATRRKGEVLFGEVFSNDPSGAIPRRPLLRAISRVAAAAQFGAGAPGIKPSKWHA